MQLQWSRLRRLARPLFSCIAFALAALLPAVATGTLPGEAPPAGGARVEAPSPELAGRYLVAVSGCNDCHTPGFMESEGRVPEEEWLTGSDVGWRGPWGTTYPSNLRLLVQELDEDAFASMLRHRVARPPMPWANVNRLSDEDARAIYRYIRALGPRGQRMPLALGPGEEPTTPYLLMEPQQPRSAAPEPTPGG